MLPPLTSSRVIVIVVAVDVDSPHRAHDHLLRNWEKDRGDCPAAASIPQAKEDKEEEG